MNIWETLILFFAFQALLMSIFFFFKKRQESYSNKILSFFLFCFGYCIFYNTLYWSGLLFTSEFIHLNTTFLIPQSLLGPLFYLYIRSVVSRKKIRLRKDVWHFIPAAYVVLSFSPYYFHTAVEKLAIYEQSTMPDHLIFGNRHTGLLLVVLMIVYTGYTYFRYTKKFEADIDLKIWLRAICLTFSGCVFAYLLYYLLAYTGVLRVEQDYIITIAMAICIGVTSYFGFVQPEVFNGKSIDTIIPFVKYEKTGLSAKLSKEMKRRLLYIMDQEKPYLNSELRLDDLADYLSLSRHHTSQVINEHFNMNFFDFINKYRIQAAIRLLEAHHGISNIKDIAYEVGFNNYVSFYKSFKKHVGRSPSAYNAEDSIEQH